VDINTDRLRIRDFSLDDLDALTNLWSDPDVEGWMTDHGPRTPEGVMRWLYDTISYNDERPQESRNCSLIEFSSGNVVGWIGIGPSSTGPPDEYNFAYALLPGYRGIGYGTEALIAVIDYCFKELKVKRFCGETAVGNVASERVMIKAGMHKTGVVDGQTQFAIDASGITPRSSD
jgi:RimJ/RimL family protein N-acetyltransferase